MRDLHRAKRKDNGEWTEGYLVKAKWYLDNTEMFVILPTDVCFFPHCGISEWHEVIPETICRCTGLTEKNGNKIWENDVVKAWSQGMYAVGKIKQRIDGYWLMYSAWQKEKFWYLLPNDNGHTTVEVIGNTFDNPELLEGINNHD